MADYLIQESTLTGIADAIRTKEGSAGPIATTDFASRIANMFTGEDLDPELGAQDALIAQISEVLDGKGFAPDPDTLVVPDAYTGLLEQAKALYDGEYAHIAIEESDATVNIAFLMDDFTVLSYDEASTEFTAIGWVYCEYTKDTLTWRVVDHRTEASTGTNYVKHIRYSSVYWEYNGQIIWPFGMSGGGGSGSKPGGAIIFARSADAVCGGDVRGVTTLTEEIT